MSVCVCVCGVSECVCVLCVHATTTCVFLDTVVRRRPAGPVLDGGEEAAGPAEKRERGAGQARRCGPVSVPLAERVRPKTISAVVGQQHLVGEESMIRKLIQKDALPSIILWGPVR